MSDSQAKGAGESPDEIRALEAMADLLAFAPEPAPPPAGLREKILARVERPASAGSEVGPGTDPHEKAPFVLAGEPGMFGCSPGWKTILPGVHVRILARESGGAYTSTMMRMEPGSEYPAHAHDALEEVCVLEGDCAFDEFNLGPGDYYQARPGSKHGSLTTRDGCVMLITELRSFKD